jgi:transposase
MKKDKKEVTIGVDVGSKFSEICVVDKNNQVLDTFKVTYTHQDLNSMLKRIGKNVNHEHSDIIMESTGPYHLILYYRFRNANYNVFVTNPMQSKAFHKVISTRKTITDKISAKTLALYFNATQPSTNRNPEANIQIRKLCRNYFTITDDISRLKRRIHAILARIFPLYKKAFCDPFGETGIAVLERCPTPTDILRQDPESFCSFIKSHSRKGYRYAQQKVRTLFHLAEQSPSVESGQEADIIMLQFLIKLIQTMNEQRDVLKEAILEQIQNNVHCQLLMTIHGIGPIIAATIMGEIGDISAFSEKKHLVAFAGIDPSVKKSGNFVGVEMKMSKRGSKYLRRVLYLAVISAIQKKSKEKGSPNPVLRAFYDKKRDKGKKKKVAIGACMRKMAGYIFAVLKNLNPFRIINTSGNFLQKKSRAVV